MNMNEIYACFRAACAARGTNITTVLNAIGRSDGSTGAWKSGKYPRLDTVIAIAENLGISIDELCFGPANKARILTDDDREWLGIISRIPPERRQMCKDFLRTHMTVPEKYNDKMDA